jgi:hypothetical protein
MKRHCALRPSLARTRSDGLSGTWHGSRITTLPNCSGPSSSGSVATGPLAAGSSPIPPTSATGTAPTRSVQSGPRGPACSSTISVRCGAGTHDRDARGHRARRSRPRGRSTLGSSGYRRCAPGQRGRRQLAAPRTGGVRARAARALNAGAWRMREPRAVRLSPPAAWASGRTLRSGRRSRSRAWCRRKRPSATPGASTTRPPPRRPGWSTPP